MLNGKIVITALFCVLSISALKAGNGSEAWRALDSGSYHSFQTIRFFNKNIGFGAGSNGEIFNTTDGGKSWQKQLSGKYSGRIWSGFFLDSLTGWYLMLSYYGTETTILRTTNGGKNWDSLFTIPYQIYSSYFHNKDTGFVSGPGGKIYKTTNGGYTWKLIPTSFSSYNFTKITFTDEKHGWVSADKWEIFKTTDGGDTWFSCRGGWGRYNDVVFADSLYGWATGVCGFTNIPFIRTIDGGANWIDFAMELPTQMYGLNFPSKKTGYAIGYSGVICKTSDSGATWRQLSFPTASNIIDLSFVDELTGWVAADNGSVYFTDSGGEDSPDVVEANICEQIKDFRLYQNFPNPFNPSTLIKYSIPREGNVTILVYNALGQKIRELVNETKPSGNYSIVFNGTGLPSGIYFYTLRNGGFQQAKKLLLLK
jgi:photosystem II stability/assembly factor-like uncharacterized protein